MTSDGDRSEHREGAPLTRQQILEYLEGVLESGGEEERRIRARLEASSTDRQFFEALREEVEDRNTSIALVWKQERVSCPHRDLLEAYHYGSLDEQEADFVRFHLDRVGCPWCSANLEDIRELSKAESERESPLRDLKDELLRSTTAFLRRRS